MRPSDIGLPDFHVRPPTLDDLDDDNVVLFNREPLVQRQFKQFHNKGVLIMQETIDKIVQKLSEVNNRLVGNQAELEGLRSQRAKLAIDDQKKNSVAIKQLDKQIDDLNRAIENAPPIIRELEEQLAEAQSKVAAENREQILNDQKTVAKEIESLSKGLVAKLKLAKEINDQLRQAYNQYNQLKEQTGANVLSVKSCEPSSQMLEYLYGFLKGELEGRHCRVLLTPPAPQI